MKPRAKIIVFGFLLVFLLSANFAQAALINCGGRGVGESGQQPACDIPALIQTVKNLINILFSYAGLVAIVLVLIAGLRMIFAHGNEEQIASAKSNLSSALLGFVIILVSFVVINFVVALLTGGKLDLINAIKLAT